MLSFARILVSLFLVSFATALPGPADENQRAANPASSTPKLQRIFTADINLGSFSAPIPIQGGQRLVASVTGGQLKGPKDGLTGTIQGGISVIDIINAGQTIVNMVQSYGVTPDGTPFLIQENGIGSPADNFARLVLSIGGPQANLANQFLITEAALSADRKTVSTTGYQLLDR
ncbi:MAG: hypothetical protein Q9182_003460 [Xanthomendoza sp. 2 TL-2023]